MIGLIEGWTDQVGKTGINDGELFGSTLFYIKCLGNQTAALSNDGSS